MAAPVERPEPAAIRQLPDHDHQRGGPTVRRIVLGTRLRRLREARGISFPAAARAIGASPPKMSRLELGRGGCKETDVEALLTLYGVYGDERDQFLELARGANTPGWWHRFGDVMPSWLETLLGLEEAAALIRTYQPQRIPGLLQTPDYARAYAALAHPDASAEAIERHVGLRLRRQELLSSPDAPRYWLALDEAALRRPLGGPEVMREQIAFLLRTAELASVHLQIVPFGTADFAAVATPVTVLRFADRDLPDIAYLEQLTSALYLDKRSDVEAYKVSLDRLCATALNYQDSVAFLRALL